MKARVIYKFFSHAFEKLKFKNFLVRGDDAPG
jgi:hypothetical protein